MIFGHAHRLTGWKVNLNEQGRPCSRPFPMCPPTPVLRLPVPTSRALLRKELHHDQGGRNHVDVSLGYVADVDDVVAEVFDGYVTSGNVEIHTPASDPMTFKEVIMTHISTTTAAVGTQ